MNAGLTRTGSEKSTSASEDAPGLEWRSSRNGKPRISGRELFWGWLEEKPKRRQRFLMFPISRHPKMGALPPILQPAAELRGRNKARFLLSAGDLSSFFQCVLGRSGSA